VLPEAQHLETRGGEVGREGIGSISGSSRAAADEAAPAALGPKVTKALAAILETLNLDYCGIDFTVNEAGEVVVFEANSNMEIIVPGSTARSPFRMRSMRRGTSSYVLLRSVVENPLRGE